MVLCEWEGRKEVSDCMVLSVGGQIGSLRLFCGSVSVRADWKFQAVLWFCQWEGRLGVLGRWADLWFCEWEGRLKISGRWAGQWRSEWN